MKLEKYLGENQAVYAQDPISVRVADRRKLLKTKRNTGYIGKDTLQAKTLKYDYAQYCGNCRYSKNDGPFLKCENTSVTKFFEDYDKVNVDKYCVCKYHDMAGI